MAVALTLEEIFVYLRFYDFEAGLWQHGTPGIVRGLLYICSWCGLHHPWYIQPLKYQQR